MNRVTVKIIAEGIPEERDFHMFADKAEKFAARVRKEGGQARIVPFQMGGALIAMLTKCGIDASKIK